jgi:hypothetical protein
MVEFQAYTKIKNQKFEKLFNYYYIVPYTIDKADKSNLGEIFLIAANIDEMSRTLRNALERGKVMHGAQTHRPGFRCLHTRPFGVVHDPTA